MGMNAGSGSHADPEDIDPRLVRSRARLLDAATGLLSTGGIEAVTIDAVTKVSKVARTTLYRHFSSSTHLLAATFERLLPQVTPPPASGTLRERLIELLSRQAVLIEETPIQLTTLAWLALGPTASGRRSDGPQDDGPRSMGALRVRVADQYRGPFDQILDSLQARAELGDFDTTIALSQLVGPIVFARLTGIHTFDHADCVRLVDDFLTARKMALPQ
ncbi:TetR/AcrR family transcriptional regulator [Antrihabitans stalactiti]|jgi:TetR/AcrR family transcriptional regulator, regulator of autoinduction and epiphytic fitness|nr:TetR/AcrR family transcriptional regulator [Antrihabitans stalactiti]